MGKNITNNRPGKKLTWFIPIELIKGSGITKNASSITLKILHDISKRAHGALNS